MSFKPNIFISYSQKDEDIVHGIYYRLTELGFKIWINFKKLGIGEKLWDEIEKGMQLSKAVLCSISEAYCGSYACYKELSKAVRLGKRIFPVILEKKTKNGVAMLIEVYH